MEKMADENCISLIINGEFNAIEGITIGELFENFFDNINYNVVRENNLYVDFTGGAICDDKPCKILIRFKVYEEKQEFEIAEIKMNDEILNDDEVYDLLEDIAYVSGIIFEEECDCGEENCNCNSVEDEEEYYDDEELEEDDDDDSNN